MARPHSTGIRRVLNRLVPKARLRRLASETGVVVRDRKIGIVDLVTPHSSSDSRGFLQLPLFAGGWWHPGRGTSGLPDVRDAARARDADRQEVAHADAETGVVRRRRYWPR